MAQEERTTGQLADVKDIPWKEESLAEDRGKRISVFASAHRPEQDDVGLRAHAIGQNASGLVEQPRRVVRPLWAESKTLQILRRDTRVR